MQSVSGISIVRHKVSKDVDICISLFYLIAVLGTFLCCSHDKEYFRNIKYLGEIG